MRAVEYTPESIMSELKLELSEMKKLGMNVPNNYEAYIDKHQQEFIDMYPSMSISEIADFVCEVA